MSQLAAQIIRARELTAQGLLEEAEQVLAPLRAEVEEQSLPPELRLQVWQGSLALATWRGNERLVQEAAARLVQIGREFLEFDSQAMGSVLHQAGLALANLGAGCDAETLLTQAFRRLPEEPQAKFDYCGQLVAFYCSYGHLEQALHWAKEAQRWVGATSQMFLAERAQALIYDALGKSLEAAGYRQQTQNRLSDQNPAWLLVDQARGQRRQGHSSRAEGLYREAIRLLPDSDKARLCRELALNQLSRRDLVGAEAALLEGSQWVTPVSFEGQLLRAEQALLWQYQGRFSECEEAILEILASWSERFQASHPLCLRLQETLIELDILRRNLPKALHRAGQLLQLASSAHQSHHPGIARALYWMALVFIAGEEREKAEQALRQAQQIWDAWPGDPSDVDRALIHYGLGLIQMDKLEFYNAEEQIQLASRLLEQRGLGSETPLLGHFLASLSEIHRITGRDRQSQQEAQRSQELLRPRK